MESENCCRSKKTAPGPRSGHKIVCDEGELYSFGGITHFHNPPFEMKLSTKIWCYNYAVDRWIKLPTTGDVPKGATYHSMRLQGNFIVVFGGAGTELADTGTNVLSICDLRTRIWRRVPTHEGETLRRTADQEMVIDEVGKTLYVIGGLQVEGYLCNIDVHQLDLKTFKWRQIYATGTDRNEPSPRCRHDLVLNGQYIFIIGGKTADAVCSLKLIPAFDLFSNQWRLFPTKGQNIEEHVKKSHRFVHLGDDVYLVGGCSFIGSNGIWKLNIKTMEWSFIHIKLSFPLPVVGHGISITEAGCLYTFGGIQSGSDRLRTKRMFKIWLKVPTLKEMCWEAICLYTGRFGNSQLNELPEIGIPPSLLPRLCPPGTDLKATGNNRKVKSFWKSTSTFGYDQHVLNLRM